MDIVGFRKILAGFVLLAVGLVVVYFKNDIPPNLLSLMQWLYLTFVGGNAIEHISTAIQSKGNV